MQVSVKAITIDSCVLVMLCISRNVNKECTFNAFPATYVSYCKQVDSERKLFVFDPKTNNITEELILTPSCCTCKLRKKDE